MRKFENIKIPDRVKKKAKLTKEEKLKIKEEKRLKKQELKELREANKEVLLSTRKLLDFIDIDEDDSIIMKNGYIDLFKIDTKDVYSLSEDEAKVHIYNYVSFLRSYNYDFKIISMKFPVNTVVQQEYIKRRLKACKNDVFKEYLNEELEKLIRSEENDQNKEFYIMIFVKENEDKKELIRNLFRSQNIAVQFTQMTLEKKLQILFKINNLNTKLVR